MKYKIYYDGKLIAQFRFVSDRDRYIIKLEEIYPNAELTTRKKNKKEER